MTLWYGPAARPPYFLSAQQPRSTAFVPSARASLWKGMKLISVLVEEVCEETSRIERCGSAEPGGQERWVGNRSFGS